MKKMISTLLILSSISCFATTPVRFVSIDADEIEGVISNNKFVHVHDIQDGYETVRGVLPNNVENTLLLDTKEIQHIIDRVGFRQAIMIGGGDSGGGGAR